LRGCAAFLHYFHRQWTSSPWQIGDVVLIPITDSFQGMPGYVATLITIWRDVTSCCRQGIICQNRARGIPKTRARSPMVKAETTCRRSYNSCRRRCRLLSPSGSLTSVQRSNTVQTRATT
jgi:hypothetical protein